jgi:hypothetical protein
MINKSWATQVLLNDNTGALEGKAIPVPLVVEQSHLKNRNSYTLLTFPLTLVIIGALKYTLLSINNSSIGKSK